MKRHKWQDLNGIDGNTVNSKSLCKNCGLIRSRLPYLRLKGEPTVCYYYENRPNSVEYTAPKCKKIKL